MAPGQEKLVRASRVEAESERMVKSLGEMLEVVSRTASGAGMAEAIEAIEARVTMKLEKYILVVVTEKLCVYVGVCERDVKRMLLFQRARVS
jgi:hypothetical protein